jgi:hypothetical protein
VRDETKQLSEEVLERIKERRPRGAGGGKGIKDP